MARTGRPRKDEGDRGTTQVRIFDEMAQQVSDLLLVLPLTSAQIIQRVCGHSLAELYETHRPHIERVKAAQKKAEEEQKKAREEVAQLEATARQEAEKIMKRHRPKSGS